MAFGRWQWALTVAALLVPMASSAQVWPDKPSSVESRLRSNNALDRRAAVAALPSLPHAVASRIVLGALRSDDDEVRGDAAGAAARLRLAPAAAIVGGWLTAPSAALRRAALRVLERVPAPEYASGIARLLSDGSPEVRVAACSALAMQVKGSVPPALIGRLDDPVADVRLAAIEALARLKSSQAVISLTGVAQADDPRLREASVHALGAIGSRQATPALVQALSDTVAAVRSAAATALGAVAAEGTEPALLALLAREVAPTVRVAVIDELSRLGSPNAIQAVVDQVSEENRTRWERERIVRALQAAGEGAVLALRRCTLESPPGAAFRCAEALVGMGAPKVQETLVAALTTGNLPSAGGLSLLGSAGDPAALPFILERLEDNDDSVRIAALDATLQLIEPSASDGRAIAPLKSVLRRTLSLEERGLAVRALGLTASPAVFEDLEPLVGADVPQSLRLAAVQSLANVHRPERDRTLISLLSDRDGDIRWAAALALRRGLDPRTAPVLVRVYRDQTLVERDLVALAMGGLRALGVAEPERRRILGLLNGERGARRDSLIEAALLKNAPPAFADVARLAKGSRPEDRAKVIELCEWMPAARKLLLQTVRSDPSLRVRANAAWALGGVAIPSDIPSLLRVASTQGGLVEGNAVASVGRIGERFRLDLSSELCRILSHPSPHVRLNTLAALAQTHGGCSAAVERGALSLDPSPYVRRAAARMMTGLGQGISSARREALLECARTEPFGSVAAACVGHGHRISESTQDELLVFVADSGAGDPSPEAPFALELPSGYVRIGVSDRRGAVLVRGSEGGTVRLLPVDSVAWSAAASSP